MNVPRNARILLALPLAVIGAVSISAAAKPAPLARAACMVTADTLYLGQASTQVVARLTENAGDSLTASVGEGAKVAVAEVKKGSAPMTVELTVNSEQAVAGEWPLTVAGKGASCAGTITVAPKKQK